MADEQYLKDIQKKADEEETRLGRVLSVIGKEVKKLNSIRTQREKAEKELEEFVGRQVGISLSKISAIKKIVDETFEEEAERLVSIGKREIEVEGKEKELEERAERVAEEEEKLSIGKRRVESIEKDVRELQKRATQLRKIAERDKDMAADKKKEAQEIERKIKQALEETTEYLMWKTNIVEQKNELLDEERKLTIHKRKLAEDALDWVKTQRIKLADQWRSLELSKQEIYGERNTGPKSG